MKKIFLSCAVLLFSVSVMAQNSVNLKMNLEKNKVYRFRSLSEQTITQTVNGNQQVIESVTDYSASIKMIDATADFMVAEVHFDTLITNTNSMGKTSSISSAIEGDIKSSKTDDIMSNIMNRLSRNAIYVKMDFSGKVLEVVNLKMLSDMILKDTASLTITGMMRSAIKTQIQNTISDNALKERIEPYTRYLPGKEIAAGDSWNLTETTNSGGMMLEISTDYHLDGIKDNTADITAESAIKAKENAVPMESGGAKITYDNLKGLSKSTIVMDTSTGLIIEVKAKTHIAGNLGVSVPGMNLDVPMDISSESNVVALK